MNECKILGYARYVSKETEEEKLRINIAIENNKNGYTGYIPLKTIFLNYTKALEDLLRYAIDNNKELKIDYNTNLASQKIEIIGFSTLDNNHYIDESVENLFNE